MTTEFVTEQDLLAPFVRLSQSNRQMLRNYADVMLATQQNTEHDIRPKIEWLPEVEAEKNGSADIWHKWKDEVEED